MLLYTALNDTMLCIQNYVVKMETLEGLPGGLVGKKNILFSNIEMLYEFNKE